MVSLQCVYLCSLKENFSIFEVWLWRCTNSELNTSAAAALVSSAPVRKEPARKQGCLLPQMGPRVLRNLLIFLCENKLKNGIGLALHRSRWREILAMQCAVKKWDLQEKKVCAITPVLFFLTKIQSILLSSWPHLLKHQCLFTLTFAELITLTVANVPTMDFIFKQPHCKNTEPSLKFEKSCLYCYWRVKRAGQD